MDQSTVQLVVQAVIAALLGAFTFLARQAFVDMRTSFESLRNDLKRMEDQINQGDKGLSLLEQRVTSLEKEFERFRDSMGEG
jgi:septal ring factor EnvC (AmiA/AmiB activator)